MNLIQTLEALFKGYPEELGKLGYDIDIQVYEMSQSAACEVRYIFYKNEDYLTSAVEIPYTYLHPINFKAILDIKEKKEKQLLQYFDELIKAHKFKNDIGGLLDS